MVVRVQAKSVSPERLAEFERAASDPEALWAAYAELGDEDAALAKMGVEDWARLICEEEDDVNEERIAE